MGLSVTLTHSGASELSQLMEGTTASVSSPEIVRRGFQDLLVAKVYTAIGATRHENCPDGVSRLPGDRPA